MKSVMGDGDAQGLLRNLIGFMVYPAVRVISGLCEAM